MKRINNSITALILRTLIKGVYTAPIWYNGVVFKCNKHNRKNLLYQSKNGYEYISVYNTGMLLYTDHEEIKSADFYKNAKIKSIEDFKANYIKLNDKLTNLINKHTKLE